MRGDKAVLLMSHSKNLRITPACAGISELSDWAAVNLQDHPRVRGDKQS